MGISRARGKRTWQTCIGPGALRPLMFAPDTDQAGRGRSAAIVSDVSRQSETRAPNRCVSPRTEDPYVYICTTTAQFSSRPPGCSSPALARVRPVRMQADFAPDPSIIFSRP
jgi:hypothetical protein